MTQEQQLILMIRGVIAQLPELDQQKVKDAEKEIRAVMEKYGEIGSLALALVGGEAAAE